VSVGSPKLQASLKIRQPIQMSLNVERRMICVNPDSNKTAAVFDLNSAIFELQRLREPGRVCKGVGR